jgi:hypothetical protein
MPPGLVPNLNSAPPDNSIQQGRLAGSVLPDKKNNRSFENEFCRLFEDRYVERVEATGGKALSVDRDSD